jgi:hypothetical protein
MKIMKGHLTDCDQRLEEVKEIFQNVKPREEAWFSPSWGKCSGAFGKAKKVEAAAKAIGNYVAALTCHHAEAAWLSKSEKDAIITAIGKLAIQVPATQDNSGDKKVLDLLNLDGRGVRRLSILVILGDIVAKVNEFRTREDHLKLCDIFHFIAAPGLVGVYTRYFQTCHSPAYRLQVG